jgi:CBS domain containing-hemolysin-like protein
MIITIVPQGSDTDVLLLILYILLALFFSFLCSIAEAVLLSITPSYVAGLRERKPKLAALLQRLKQENVDRSLAAILTLNTIAHTVGAIGAGAKATAVFGSAWFGVFSAVMTLMILVLSEIIPKTLGAVHWRALAGLTARFVRILIVTLYPLILISERITRLLARGKKVHVFSRDEFVAMAAVGEAAGQLNARESGIIHNLFRFDSLRARDIMTPRTVILALAEHITVDEALDGRINSPFSRLPVYGKDLDDVTGFVLRSDMLLAKAEQRGGVRLSALRRDILSAPVDTSLSRLLQLLLDHRSQIALLVDEYGGTTGLVTLEDVVETLLGMEVVDEMDTVEDMQALAREIWSRRAAAIGIDTKALE